MTMHHPKLAELVRRDPRYAYEAYEFVFAALAHTQKMLGRSAPDDPHVEPGPDHHVSGRELLQGVRDLALREFGLMARTVFRLWGIDRTDDFGEIVFKLVAEGLMDPAAADDRAAFHDLFDLQDGLVDGYRIEAGEGLEEPS
jgi:uncharacterized repeat protein (TIGR04138 family)